MRWECTTSLQSQSASAWKWSDKGSPPPKEIQDTSVCRQDHGKCVLEFRRGIRVDILQHSVEISASCYRKLLRNDAQQAICKKKKKKKKQKFVLLHNSARQLVHMRTKFMKATKEKVGSEIMKNSPYSPEIAPVIFNYLDQ
jgi:hypothetical protein